MRPARTSFIRRVTVTHSALLTASCVLPLLVLLSFSAPSSSQRQSRPYVGPSNAPLLSPLCYRPGGDDLSREVPAELTPATDCLPEQQSPIPYRLHTQRYPYCRRQCPVAVRPRGCALSELTQSGLLHLLAGRRLVLWGDSVSRMHYEFLVRVFFQGCVRRPVHFSSPRASRSATLRSAAVSLPGLRGFSLRASTSGGGAVLKKARACRPLPPEERGARSCVQVRSCQQEGASAAAEICYVHSFKEALSPDSEGCLEHLRPTDIVVFNTGLHFQPNEQNQYARSLKMLASSWSRIQEDAAQEGRPAPLAIWRETSPQHFHTPGGEFAFRTIAKKGGYSCANVERQEALQHNWRNRIASRMLPSMPVLRVWSLSLNSPQLHTQFRVKPGGEAYADCTHFCISERGIYFAWSTLLFNQLASLLPASSRQ